MTTPPDPRRVPAPASRQPDEDGGLFRRCFDRGAIGMAVLSPTTTWLEVNQRLCAMLGYTTTELRATTLVDLTHPDDLAGATELLDRLVAGEISSYDLEQRFIRRDGSVLDSHLFLTCLNAADASVEHVLVHIQDIGERKRADDLLRLQRDLTVAMAAARSIDEAASLCVRTAMDATGAEMGALYLVDPCTHALRLVHAEGGDEQLLERVSSFEPGSPVHGLVMSARPIYTAHNDLPEELPEHLRAHMLSSGAVPILHDGEVVACVNVGSSTLPELPPTSRTALEGIAGHAGAVIARLHTEQALRDREHRYRSLFETAQVGIFRSRIEDGRFVAINTHGARLLGFSSPEELLARRMTTADLFAGGRRVDMLERIRQDGEVTDHEVRWHLRDGRELEVVISARADLDQGTIEGVAVDVSELKRVQAELEQAQQVLEDRVAQRTRELAHARDDLATARNHLDSIINSVADPLFVKDRHHRFVLVNDACCQLIGRRRDELLGRTDEGIFPPEQVEIFWKHDDEVLSTGREDINEELITGTDEITRTIVTKKTLHSGPRGAPLIVGVIRDMTQAKETEEELRRTNLQLEAANRELEAFAYSVSHDLRAPLRSIDGFSQILLEDHREGLDGEGRDLLTRVRRAAQRMGRLIDDLLALSRATRVDMSVHDINLGHVSAPIIQQLREAGPHREAEIVVDPDLTVVGDPHLLGIILENLLGNAWKYTASRATARIEVGRLSPEQADASGHPGEHVLFVRDNGVGFDMAYADKLFGPFQRLHGHDEFPGTGIGLATVQRIVHRHGGEVWADAAVDQGATIYFTLG